MPKNIFFTLALCISITMLGMEEKEPLLQPMPTETIVDIEGSTKKPSAYKSPFANIDFSTLSLDESINALPLELRQIIGDFKFKQCMQNYHNAKLMLDNFNSYSDQKDAYQHLAALMHNGIYLTEDIFLNIIEKCNSHDGNYPSFLQKLLPKLNKKLLSKALITAPDRFVPILIQSGADIHQRVSWSGYTYISALDHADCPTNHNRAQLLVETQYPNTTCGGCCYRDGWFYHWNRNRGKICCIVMSSLMITTLCIGGLLNYLYYLNYVKH